MCVHFLRAVGPAINFFFFFLIEQIYAHAERERLIVSVITGYGYSSGNDDLLKFR